MTMVKVAVAFAATVPRLAVTVRPETVGVLPWARGRGNDRDFRREQVGQHHVMGIEPPAFVTVTW